MLLLLICLLGCLACPASGPLQPVPFLHGKTLPDMRLLYSYVEVIARSIISANLVVLAVVFETNIAS
ncbi:hypothetical protein GGR57DRAFT_468731 [Xylariaceae sp. FL1272]|nr:hypothetical protein GGR57DRAFT_468731 [Xylariaceae sp. FL1272]